MSVDINGTNAYINNMLNVNFILGISEYGNLLRI